MMKDSLKKVYNDLAESHAKQVIEIQDLKNGNDHIFEQALEQRRKVIALEQEKDDLELQWFTKNTEVESELLKAKELLKNVIRDIDPRFGFVIKNDIEKFLNKKP